MNREPGEGLIISLPIAEVGIRDRAGIEIRFAGMDRHQLAGLRIGERIQQHSVHHGEERRVGADPQRKGQDGDEREAGILGQNAQAIGHILGQRFEKRQAAPLAICRLGLFEATEFDERLTARFFFSQAGAHPVLDVHGEMAFQLCREVSFGLLRVADAA